MAAEEGWIKQVDMKLQQTVDKLGSDDPWENRSIYLIPPRVSKLNNEAYVPVVVSFGPYHKGDQDLIAMEEHKQRAVVQFLKRSNVPLLSVIQSLADDLKDLKESYDSLDGYWKENSSEFVEMMILDGCFMLEIFLFATGRYGNEDYHTINNPIFSKHGKLHLLPHIKRDMLLLENQLPMLVLYKLFHFQFRDNHEEEHMNNMIEQFFFSNRMRELSGKCLHVLDLYRKIMIGRSAFKRRRRAIRVMRKVEDNFRQEIIPPAKELNIVAGIKIKKYDHRSWTGISFKDGVLEIPAITVDGTTKTILLNMIAFERFHFFAGNEVTSYVYFMDSIIRDERDVELLQSEEIIKNSIGSNNAVADMFNSLTKDIPFDPYESNISNVFEDVRYYFYKNRKSWNRWRADLMELHFKSPWTCLALFAAIILFILTTIQTAFTIYPIFKT